MANDLRFCWNILCIRQGFEDRGMLETSLEPEQLKTLVSGFSSKNQRLIHQHQVGANPGLFKTRIYERGYKSRGYPPGVTRKSWSDGPMRFHVLLGTWNKKKHVTGFELQQTDTREMPRRGEEANLMEKLEENASVNVSQVASVWKAILGA